MSPRSSRSLTLAALVTAGLAACSRPAAPAAEAHDHPGPQALFTNGDFEVGTLASWAVSSNINNGIVVPPTTLANLQLQAGGNAALSKVVTGAVGSVIPAGLSSGASLRIPRYGSNVAVVNELGLNRNVNSILQQMVTTNADVDPVDNKVHVRFAVAPVLENPGHVDTNQPYFWVQLRNVTRGTILFYTFNFSNQPGVPWKSDPGLKTPSVPVLYTDWQSFDISPGPAALAVGDTVEMLVIAAGCSQAGHFGELYVDAFGPVLPGLAVTASAPAQVNTGTTLTYTLTYKNSGPGVAANTTIVENLPAGTTFAAVSAPGATCTTPTVGTTGTVTCNVGTVNVAATGTITVTVNVTAAAGATISNGDYNVTADGASPLVGPLVSTAVTSGVTYADLGMTMTDGQPAVAWGQRVTYTLVASNAGPGAASGATVSDTMPAQLTNVTWTCAAAGGAACIAASGTGNIAQAIPTFPSGGTVTYTVSADVVAGSGTGSLVNQASIAAPGGVTDNVPSNNTAVDSDAIGTLFPLTVQKAGTGRGTVLSSPAAISCGAACSSQSASYLSGTGVVLTATAGPGQVFNGWSGGGCSGTASTCTVTVGAATTVTTTFSTTQWSVTGTASSGGSVSCTSPVDWGTASTCTLAPLAGYQLTGLTDNGSDVLAAVSGGSYVIASVTANHAVAATYTLIPPVLAATAGKAAALTPGPAVTVDPGLTVTYGGNLTGATASVGTGFVTGQDVLAFTPQSGITGTYNAVTGVLTLTGTASATAYQAALRTVTYLNSAGGSANTADRPVIFSVGANPGGSATRLVSVTIAQFTLTFQTDGTAGTSLTGTTTQTVVAGQAASAVTAVPTATTYFVNWTGTGGFVTSTANPLTVSNVTAAQSITAHFAAKAVTTVAMSSSAATSVHGQPVTFTATVSTAPTGGTVQFLVDGVAFGGPVPVVAGVATSPAIATLTTASHSVTASYTGDTSHLASSGAFTQIVQPAATTTALASSVNPSRFGQPVTLTATVAAVAPGAGIPGGTVTFFDGATSLGAVTLNASGVATLTTAALSASTHPVTAVYSASTDFAASTSAALSEVVNAASTTTALASSANPSQVGQQVTLTATVAPVAPGAGTPAGTVTFFDGTTSLGTGALDGSGVATFATSALAAGSHSLTAVYGATPSFATSTSPVVSQAVNVASTTTTLTSSVGPSLVGQPVTLTATVAPVAPGGGTPTGTVSFYDGATLVGTGTLVNGVATLTTSSLALGSHPLTAVYGATGSYTASTSAAVGQVVNGATTSTALTSSAEPSTFGQPITLTATVTVASPGSGTPAGTVTFKDGATVLGTGTLSGGVATLTTSALGAGAHALTAEYGGSPEFGASTGPLSHQVQQGTVALTLTPSPSPAAYGAPVTLTVSASAVSPGSGTPGGLVVILDGTVEVGRVTLDGSGHGTLVLTRPVVGDHPLTANYLGDASFQGGASAAGSLKVEASSTTVAVATSRNPSRHGRPITFTATVASAASQAIPDGTVVFKADGVVLGQGVVRAGVATFTDRTLAHKGTPYEIVAEYTGSPSFQAGSGTLAGGQTVQNSPPVAGAGEALAFGPAGATTASIPLSGALDSGDLTLEAWAKADWTSPSGAGATPTVVKLGGPTETVLALGLSPDRTQVTWTAGAASRSVAAPVDDGAWHHLAVVSTSAGSTLYVDGRQADTAPGARAGVGAQLLLGEGFVGQVDEVRAWSVARTAAELADAARRPLASEPAGLVGHWHLDEGSGDEIFDASAGAHDGTVTLASGVTGDAGAFVASQAWRLRQVDQERDMAPPADAGYDPDGDPLTLTIPTPPAHGSATKDDAALQVRYRAGDGYLGSDTLTFALEDDSRATSTYQLELQVSRILTCRVTADCGGGEQCVQSACAAPGQLDARAGKWGCSTGAGAASGLWAFLLLGLARRRPRRQVR